MQTYLIISDFRQRKNAKGKEYGWHLAAYETPETKWGRDHVASAYSSDPEASWGRITAQMKKYYPEVTDRQIMKMLGIRWPGEATETHKVSKKRSEKERADRGTQCTGR